MKQIKVLAFDTGGTVLDWHTGLTAAMAAWGTARGIERDWHAPAHQLGWPDSGTSMRDMVDNARKIVLTVQIPVFADADTGYDDAILPLLQ